MFQSWDNVFRFKILTFFLQTKETSLGPKSSIFVWSEHKTDDQKIVSLSIYFLAKYNWAFTDLAVKRGVFLGQYPLSTSILSVFCSVVLKISIPSIQKFCKSNSRAFTNFSHNLSCWSTWKFHLSFSFGKVLYSFKLLYDVLNSWFWDIESLWNGFIATTILMSFFSFLS